MSFLFGAFFFGAAAIAAPILLHLIRRTPKERYQFSSLMFLQPSPPKLTKRSRLDQWLLLLLRCLAIILLALAFIRPFFTTRMELLGEDAPKRFVALIIDRSASMQQAGLWEELQREVDTVIDSLDRHDRISLYAFDENLETIVSAEPNNELSPSQRRELVRSRVGEIRPTWGSTNLANALLDVAAQLKTAVDLEPGNASQQIILVSDLQAGSNLEGLQINQWPETVSVDIRRLIPSTPSNAKLRLVQSPDDTKERSPRVRVRNVAGSEIEQFDVWWSAGEQSRSEPVRFYVPPGESQVLAVPYNLADSPPDRLKLAGDAPGLDFDNTYYVVPPIQELVNVAYFGSEAGDDPDQMRFYLERAFYETPNRKITIETFDQETVPNWKSGNAPRLAIISTILTKAQQQAIDQYLESGGQGLVMLTSDAMVKEMGNWMSDVRLADAKSDSIRDMDTYWMLEAIDFRHPLFAPFATARFNDFTKVRFWKRRQVDLSSVDSATVIARFEQNVPAIWSVPRGNGHLYAMSSTWNREDSQLALSTKFVPLISRFLELATRKNLVSDSYEIGQPIGLPESNGKRVVTIPDGTRIELSASEDVFLGASKPGIYRLSASGEETLFAINLADSESNTASLPVERLEQLGLKVGTAPTPTEQLDQLEQLRNIELENRQKLWKWLVVAVLVLLGAETWLAAIQSGVPATATGDTA